MIPAFYHHLRCRDFYGFIGPLLRGHGDGLADISGGEAGDVILSLKQIAIRLDMNPL